MDIWSLARQGYSQKAIARKLGLNRSMVARYLNRGEFPSTGRPIVVLI